MTTKTAPIELPPSLTIAPGGSDIEISGTDSQQLLLDAYECRLAVRCVLDILGRHMDDHMGLPDQAAAYLVRETVRGAGMLLCMAEGYSERAGQLLGVDVTGGCML